MPGFVENAWQHVAAVYDQGRVELFLNGQSLGAAQQLYTSDLDLDTDTDEPVTLGAKLAGSTVHMPFFGRLDEVHIYDRALAEWEIEELMDTTP